MNPALLCSIALLALIPTAANSIEEAPTVWTAWEDGSADVRQGVFKVPTAECGYHTMADLDVMGRVLPHLQKITVHSEQGSFQDVTFVEKFFPVGTVESRYHRTVDGAARLEWKLVKGQQAKHDGWWQVDPDGVVTFRNAIQAKSFLHRALLRSIQVRAMESIADSVREHCATH